MDYTELGRTYLAVLAAELIADRSAFSIGALATRLRARTVIVGLVLGCLAKAFVAVAFGRLLRAVPDAVLAFLGAGALVWGGMLLLRNTQGNVRESAPAPGAGLWATFATVLFVEWGDIGQITAAFVASRSADLAAVWIGASLALITKGTLAALLVASLRHFVPARAMVRVGAVVCFVMAVLTLLRIEH